ncbi:hypothetical protein SERLA73DRAFT_73804 [Serpula lacrymans var. lacrymans S7.3]|uniref:Transmembrane protein n=2 Tax=Serpula lacrymans var. lacrymans TaxID=341189 RepID=F8PWU1_SERL3|nr:uncharacterized protein SERLADRAFT_370077 [Serpula lacrymans var. lacrymans S7.9]EGN99268.1 hypothetical protein SERLA73DRAFT_73804 [Serpula lacrymans var. lacrymans S7.3]EGO24833.1 hypothetical protein SERLADRAFT_370077 [Serpula lacrymans var. lacrymans S7.9]
MSTPRQNPTQRSLSTHTLRQLKFVIPGTAITYYLDTYHVFLSLLTNNGSDGWGSTFALGSLTLGGLVVVLFLYVLLVPWIRGIETNYRSWRESGILSSVIPILTASILTGWSLLSFTLGGWSGLGYLKGIIGASGLYALVFGLMGLISAPRVHRS